MFGAARHLSFLSLATMAPTTIKRKAAAGTKDIRNFFGSSQSSQPKVRLSCGRIETHRLTEYQIQEVAFSGTSKLDSSQHEVTGTYLLLVQTL